MVFQIIKPGINLDSLTETNAFLIFSLLIFEAMPWALWTGKDTWKLFLHHEWITVHWETLVILHIFSFWSLKLTFLIFLNFSVPESFWVPTPQDSTQIKFTRVLHLTPTGTCGLRCILTREYWPEIIKKEFHPLLPSLEDHWRVSSWAPTAPPCKSLCSSFPNLSALALPPASHCHSCLSLLPTLSCSLLSYSLIHPGSPHSTTIHTASLLTSVCLLTYHLASLHFLCVLCITQCLLLGDHPWSKKPPHIIEAKKTEGSKVGGGGCDYLLVIH